MAATIKTFGEVYSPDGTHLADLAKHFGKENQVHDLLKVIDAHIKTAIANTTIVGNDPQELLINLIKTRRQMSMDPESFDKMMVTFLSTEDLDKFGDILNNTVPDTEVAEGTYGVGSDNYKLTDPKYAELVKFWSSAMDDGMIQTVEKNTIFIGSTIHEEAETSVSLIPGFNGSPQGGGGKGKRTPPPGLLAKLTHESNRSESARERARKILEDRRAAQAPPIEDKKLAPVIKKAEELLSSVAGSESDSPTATPPAVTSSRTLPKLFMALLASTIGTPAAAAPPLARSASNSALIPVGSTAGPVLTTGLAFGRDQKGTFSEIDAAVGAAIEAGFIPPAKERGAEFGVVLKEAIKPLSSFLSSHPELRMKILTLVIEQFSRFLTKGPVIKKEIGDLWKEGIIPELEALGEAPEMSVFLEMFPTVTPVPIATPSPRPAPTYPVEIFTPKEEMDAKDFAMAKYPYTEYVRDNSELIANLRKQGINNVTGYEGEDIEYAGLPPKEKEMVDAGVEAVMKHQYFRDIIPTLKQSRLEDIYKAKKEAHPGIVAEHAIDESARIAGEVRKLKDAALKRATETNAQILATVLENYNRQKAEYTRQLEIATLTNVGANITVADFGRLIPGIKDGSVTIIRSFIIQEELTNLDKWHGFFTGSPIIYPGLRFDLIDTAGTKSTVQFDLRQQTDLEALKPLFVHFYCNDMAEKPDVYKSMVCSFISQLEEIDVISIALLGLNPETIKEPGIATIVAAKNKISRIIIDDGIYSYMNYTHYIAGEAYKYLETGSSSNTFLLSMGGEVLPPALTKYDVIMKEFEDRLVPDDKKIEFVEELYNSTIELNPDPLTRQAAEHFLESAAKVLNTTKNVVISTANMMDNGINTLERSTEWFSINWHLSLFPLAGAIIGGGLFLRSFGISIGSESGCSCCGMCRTCMSIVGGILGTVGSGGIGAAVGGLGGYGIYQFAQSALIKDNPIGQGSLVIAALAAAVSIAYLKGYFKQPPAPAAVVAAPTGSGAVVAAPTGSGAAPTGSGAVVAAPTGSGAVSTGTGTGAVAAAGTGAAPLGGVPTGSGAVSTGSGAVPAAGSGAVPAAVPLGGEGGVPPAAPKPAVVAAPTARSGVSLLGPGPGAPFPPPPPHQSSLLGTPRRYAELGKVTKEAERRARRAASKGPSAGAGTGQGGGYRMTGKNKRKTGTKRQSRKRLTRRKNRKL